MLAGCLLMLAAAPTLGEAAERNELGDELLGAAMAFIEPFEGRRHRVYVDSRGHATIGVGFNLDRPGAAEDLARLLPGVRYDALRRGEQRLTDAQIDTLLRHDVRRAIEVAHRYVPGLDDLPHIAQLVIVDMTYNMGSLREWTGLRAALAERDFDEAAAEMHDSRWRRQTGRRAKKLIEIMRGIGAL